MSQLAIAAAKRKARGSVAAVQTQYSNDQTWKVQGDYAIQQSTGEVRWVPPLECREEILSACHNLWHESQDATMARVQEIAC